MKLVRPSLTSEEIDSRLSRIKNFHLSKLHFNKEQLQNLKQFDIRKALDCADLDQPRPLIYIESKVSFRSMITIQLSVNLRLALD
jgi:hypothetical protein